MKKIIVNYNLVQVHVCAECLHLWRRLRHCLLMKKICRGAWVAGGGRNARCDSDHAVRAGTAARQCLCHHRVSYGWNYRRTDSNSGTILPPMVIISVISVFYEQFRTNPYIATALEVMRAGVAAVIFDVVINLAGNVVRDKAYFIYRNDGDSVCGNVYSRCQRDDHYFCLSWNRSD